MNSILSQYQKGLRTQILVIVLCLLGFYVINMFAGGIVEFIGLMTSNFMSNFSQALSDPAALTSIDINAIANASANALSGWIIGLASCVGIVLGACIMFALRGKRLVTTDLTHVHQRIQVSDFLLIIVLILGVQAFVTFASYFYQVIAGSLGGPLPSDLYDNSITSILTTPTGILYVVLIGPICEEIIFRGAIMRSLERYGVNFAIVISALLFAAYHLILFQAFFAFWIGLLLAYVCQRFSIKWSMLLHILNNLFSATIFWINPPDAVMISFYALILVGSVVILVTQRRRIAAELSLRRPASMLYVLGIPRASLPYLVDNDAAAQSPLTMVSDNRFGSMQSTGGANAAPNSQAPPGPAVVSSGSVGAVNPALNIIPPLPSPGEPRPRPFAVTFSGAAMIVTLCIALIISVLMEFA